jgi:hypothetical protein
VGSGDAQTDPDVDDVVDGVSGGRRRSSCRGFRRTTMKRNRSIPATEGFPARFFAPRESVSSRASPRLLYGPWDGLHRQVCARLRWVSVEGGDGLEGLERNWRGSNKLELHGGSPGGIYRVWRGFPRQFTGCSGPDVMTPASVPGRESWRFQIRRTQEG